MNLPKFAGMAVAAAVWSLLLPGECFAQQAIGQGPNLLKNPTFDRGTDGWKFQAWYDRVAKAVKDPEVHYRGRPSVRVDQPNPTDSALTQDVRLKPGTHYRLAGWIKTEDVVKPDIAKQRHGDEGASLTIMGGYEKTPSVIGTNDWTYVSLDFVTKAETHYTIGCRLGHYGKLVTGTAWFADILLVELGKVNSPRRSRSTRVFPL